MYRVYSLYTFVYYSTLKVAFIDAGGLSGEFKGMATRASFNDLRSKWVLL